MKRVFLVSLLVASGALAGELEGVTSPDTLTIEGKALVLNGMGLRKKFIVNVYVASLYVEKATKDGQAILAADSVRRVELKMLRDLGKDKIVDAIKEGFEKNSGDKLASLQARLDALCNAMPDLKKGQSLVVQYVPGKGTQVEAGGKAQTLEGKDFADALFAVWLGKSPADAGLKKGLLGDK